MNRQKTKLFSLVLLACVGLSSSLDAETFAEKTLQQQGDLILPRRITVGLNDHFQSVIIPGNKSIIYSESSQLAVRLFRQSLSEGFGQPLLDEKFDSKDPAVSPNSKIVAFTGFGQDSRGDICLFEFESKKVRCLTDRKSEDRQPFWLSDQEIGYLSRGEWDENFSLIVTSLTPGGTPHKLASGRISDPSVSSDGRYIAYTRLSEGRSQIEILDRRSNKVFSFTADLPGFTSFHRFGPQDDFLYFGQYTSDTNNDFQVDGRDQSAIFRVDVSEVLSGEEPVPHPLTSINFNCNYPTPTEDRLLMTCATPTITGDGVLDIYELPLTGMIPSDWSERYIQRAIQTARSYSDRVLLHTKLMAMNPALRSTSTYRRLLSNSIMDEQWVASLFYNRKLAEKTKSPRDLLVGRILESLSIRARAGDNPLSAQAQRQIAESEKVVRSVKWVGPLKDLAEASIAFAREDFDRARSRLQKIQSSALMDLIELHLLTYLQDRVGASGRIARLQRLSEHPELNIDAQAYYAYQLLLQADREGMDADDLGSLKFAKDSSLARLVELERILVKIRSDDVRDSSNQKAYAELMKSLDLLSKTDALMRVALTRSIMHFAARGFWTYMSFVSSRWLNWQPKEDPEFGYARRQFLSTTLERAYGRYGDKKFSRAGDQFYNALPATDDLEAHHGFIRSRIQEGKIAELKAAYEGLQKQGAVRENLMYVRALERILLAELSSKESFEIYEGSLRDLEGMPNKGFNQAPRLALMSYAAQKMFLKSKNREHFEKANYYGMLALDLSTNNERLASTLLMNLGRLHQAAGNHGQSLTFLELRKRFRFESLSEQQAFSWTLAAAQYFNRNPQEAYRTMQAALITEEKSEFRERAAFYALQAGEYLEASRHYEKYFAAEKNGQIQSRLGYAYALFKLKNSKAKKEFERIRELSKSTSATGTFPAIHYRQLSLGYLVQLEASPARKLALLDERRQLFDQMKSDLNAFRMKAEDWSRSLLQIEHQRADCLLKLNRGGEARALLAKSFGLIRELKSLEKNPLDPVLVQALVNVRSSGFKSDEILKLQEEMIAAVKSVPELKERRPYINL